MRTRHRWVSVGREPLQRAEHQAEQAWTTRRKQKCWEHSPNGALQSPWCRSDRSLWQRVKRQTRRHGKWTTQMEGEKFLQEAPTMSNQIRLPERFKTTC